MVTPLDYFLAAGQEARSPLDSSLFRSAALGTLEGVLAWGHDRPQNIRLLGSSEGRPGLGVIPATTSRLDLREQPEGVLAACADAALSPSAANLGAALASGLCRILSCRGGYRGLSQGVGSGTDRSFVEILTPREFEAALVERFAANGLCGPAAQYLLGRLSLVLLLELQRAAGSASVEGSSSRGWASGATRSALVLDC